MFNRLSLSRRKGPSWSYMFNCGIIIILLFFIYACGSLKQKEINNDKCLDIRYVNLNILFDYSVNNNPEARNIKKKKRDLLKKIDEITRKINTTKNNKEKILKLKLQEYYSKIDDIEKDEEYYKGIILSDIDYAVNAVARKHDIDYVLNIGEGAVYAGKEYDITEEVLRIIINRKKRSSPIAR